MKNNFGFKTSKFGPAQRNLAPNSFNWPISSTNVGFFGSRNSLRAATLSITNNIAEGSGSTSDIDFANFLNTSRRSTFEVANILFLLGNNGYLPGIDLSAIVGELEQESRMLLAFIRALKSAARKKQT